MKTQKLIDNMQNVKKAVDEGKADDTKTVKAVLSCCLVLCRKVQALEDEVEGLEKEVKALKIHDILSPYRDIFGGGR